MTRQLGIFFIAALAVVMTGCRPKGILTSRQMRHIIVDLHKTDALMYEKGIHNNKREAKAIYYAQVMEKHHTTQAQFDSSLVWYTAHPALFDKIYPKVLKDLKAEETAFLELYPEFGMPNEPAQTATIEETRAFTRNDLDSVLWIMRNGPCSSWTEWQRPYRLTINELTN